jgi:DNA-binding transcriptional MerR regulator
MKGNLYTIGEAAEICGVSKKTLRYYDELGLIHPSQVSDTTGYRYYTRDTLLAVPIVKYYKQMGFTLNEMIDTLESHSSVVQEELFNQKLLKLREQETVIRNSIASTEAWRTLIREGRIAHQNHISDMSVKYFPEDVHYAYLDQGFCYDYKDSIINFEWTQYLHDQQLEIVGPIILNYSSFKAKLDRTVARARIMQKTLQIPDDMAGKLSFGGFMALSCYHFGDFTELETRYRDMQIYADTHHYKLRGDAYERYVVDYWSTTDTNRFVTEIIFPLVCETE